MHNGFDKICQKYNILESIELKKGHSKDKKYILKSCNNRIYILRLSNIKYFELKKKQYELLNKLNNSINCSKVLEFGIFDEDYCFFITTFVDGVDAIDIVNNVNEKGAYTLGVNAGKILKKWHSTVIGSSNISWYEIYKNKKDKIVKELLECIYRIPSQDKLLKYYDEKLYLMNDRPLVFCHGDYHLGNMVIKNNKIGIIDVANCSLADPYEEFKRSYWNIIENEYFQTGMVNGYFNDHIPNDFFEILKFYSIESMITRLLRAINKGNIKNAIESNACQVKWWGGFDYTIPTWYLGVLFK